MSVRKIKIASALILIGLITGIAGVTLIPSVTYSKDQKIIDPDTIFADQKMPLSDLRAKYHDAINSIFNEGFKQITSGKKANTASAENDDECKFDAKPLNVSTYCIAWRGVKLYYKYNVELQRRRGELFDAGEGVSDDTPLYEQSGIIENMYRRIKVIDREVSDAKQALDTTLQAYKEFQYAYPMHKAYEETFKLLIKYRDLFAEIRDQVEKFPNKFIDASTTKCQ